jgi:NADPH:quinone reductase-like Zn-dependent oxidoreductase
MARAEEVSWQSFTDVGGAGHAFAQRKQRGHPFAEHKDIERFLWSENRMKVIEIRDTFGLHSLKLVEHPDLLPGPGQVVLKMKAFSINYRDLLVVNGVGRWKPPLPRVPLSDGVGIVTAAGNGVSRVQVGDRVAPIFYPKWLEGNVAFEKMGQALGGAAADGVLAEYTLFDQVSLVHVPSHLTDEEAATLPCAGVTAWSALIPFAHITPGDTVVVLGTGGVSIFALQFARMLGARVIVTSSSDQKLARAKELGAAAVINYKVTPDWPRTVMELTDGVGADHVVDTVGGLKEAIAAVRLGGTVAFVGLLIGMTAEVDLVTFMGKCARVEAVDVGSRAMFEAMNKAMAFHGIHPVVDRVFAFNELGEALTYLSEARHFGKVCLRA